MTPPDHQPVGLSIGPSAGPPDGRRAYHYARRRTREVRVGDVGIGGDNPIRVQSMTTTRTLDTAATVAQAARLAAAGCELVRITAPTVEDAANLREIRAQLRARGVGVPLIADIHFSPRAALEAAKWVEKVRINPGNYADARRFARLEYTDAEYARELARLGERLLPLIRHCREHGVALRIGVNHGSLSDRIMSRYGDTPAGMVESALEFVRICERHGYRELVLSMKASNPKVMIQAYRLLATRLDAAGMDYPFHLGVTEAGSGVEARVKSAAGSGALLDDGIGDTVRVSLAEEPEAELPVARWLADLYSGRPAAARLAPLRRPLVAARPEPRDPFAYRRRAARAVRLGRVTVGSGSVPRVLATLPAGVDLALLDGLFERGGSPRAWPDLLAVELDGLDAPAARARLAAVGAALAGRGLRAPLLASSPAEQAPGLVAAVAGLAAGLRLRATVATGEPAGAALRESVRATAALGAERGLPLWLELGEPGEAAEPPGLAEPDAEPAWPQVVEELLALAAAAATAGHSALLLGARCADPSRAIRATRLLAARLAELGRDDPLALVAVPAAAPPAGSPPLDVALTLGSLLADGLGDVVRVEPGAGLDEPAAVRLAYDCLQAAGARSFKAELIACPSCGRTLFDLQSTTERIKARTGHLVGVKIAVMGCVVNGPGELADADFGYMGGAPGQVSLYVGRECVERGIPAAAAEERLVELIKAHGRWVEPGGSDVRPID